MALILKDRVKETTAVTSTGTATLLGAVTGYQSFSAIGNGNTCYYTIAAQTTNEWEVGIGTYTSPDQLSRDTVLSSSNSGSLVNFSAGTKDVFVAQPSSKAVYTDATNIINTSGNGANTVTFTNINASNVVMVSGTISTNASNATDITNKTYVDNLFSTGITYHDPVLVESPIALIATYNQPGGAGNGVGATLTNSGANVALSIDGVSLSNTARVLVYQQSNAVQNGVYTVTNPGAPDAPGPGAAWVLTRATDADTYGVGDPNKLGQGDAFFVQSGNTGAGETYILNTVGTITFGTTNLTFAQISSAQVYSAGTGLNLTNLAFSISNTAVTAAQYGNDGAVGQFTVNAQGQITNAANVSINASSISVGTLANGRTTADSANGASTIVLRDANGSFAANVVTATTVNATSGNFTNITGNAVALTAINASNITSGTIANARTTASDANGASTIVTRDANGAFSAGNVTAANFIGAGTTITSINASNISSGTIANARTTAASANGASTIVSRDSGGNFSANTVTAAVIGDISGGSNINASNIASGTIANARTTASASNGASTIVLRDAGGAFAAGAITGTSFSGNGSALTAINASAITTGTLDNARTSAASANGASTIVARDAGGNFSANTITATTFSGAHSGNGAALTSINASNISSGTIANARTTASDANGASTIVARDVNGSFTANIITANGSAISAINGSNVTTGTVANARTTAATANGASTIVLRGTSGEFSAGAITGASFTGSGSGLTSIPNSATTAASANGASTIVARDANGSFTANVGTFTTVSGAGGGLTSINASNLSSGTVASARISGSYTGITGVGTLSAGVWQGTSISTTYTDAKVTSVNGSTGAVTVSGGQYFGSAAIKAIAYNANTIGENLTVTTGNNGLSAGPITISSGFTVTVQSGAVWVIV
jgi:trimeric autotransporter adhesin